MWRACQKGKADFAFKPSDDLEAYGTIQLIRLMIMRKTKMARQAKPKVMESWLQWQPFPLQVHFFDCLIPLPALCSSTSKYHSSLCHFVQIRLEITSPPTTHTALQLSLDAFYAPPLPIFLPAGNCYYLLFLFQSHFQLSCFSKTWVHIGSQRCCENHFFPLPLLMFLASLF